MSEPLTLNSRQCAEIALYMFSEYQKAPSQKFAYVGFDVWLSAIIEREKTKEKSA